MRANERGATYGGNQQQSKLKCGNCGHEVVITDPQFVDRGPIRCGACGEEIQKSILRRTLMPDAAGPSPSSSW